MIFCGMLAIIGAGQMGQAVAWWALLKGVDKVTLFDHSQSQLDKSLDRLSRRFPGKSISVQLLQIGSSFGQNKAALLKSHDRVCLCLPPSETVQLLTDQNMLLNYLPQRLISITRITSNHLSKINTLLHEVGSSLIIPAGLEPGLTEIFVLDLINRLPKTSSIATYCGGLVSDPKPPFYHCPLFGKGLSGVRRPAWTIIDGRMLPTHRYDGLENLTLPPFGEVEAFHDGLMFEFGEFLLSRKIKNFQQKTIRWLGFTNAVTLLEDAGLLADVPIPDGLGNVSEFTQCVIAKHLSYPEGASDTTLLHVEAYSEDRLFGGKKHLEVTCWPEEGLTSMALVTGAAAALTCFMPLIEQVGAWQLYQASVQDIADYTETLTAMLKETLPGFVLEDTLPCQHFEEVS